MDQTPLGTKTSKLFIMAQHIAYETKDFFSVKGPGAGDKANAQFMKLLRGATTDILGGNFSEKKVCKGAKYAFDFYLPDESTAVEIALGLHNPISEYERDIWKCVLAKDEGLPLDTLVFIARPGALTRQGAP